MPPEIIIPIIFACIIGIVWTISTYNKFVKYENRIEESWSTIDIALKRRFNIIPSMISIVKGYSTHESEVFESKIDTLKDTDDTGERLNNETKITHSLSSMLAFAEAYPELKASANFLNLQNNLAEVEVDIQEARVRYNNFVARLNTLVDSFPANFIATKFGFEKKDYFTLDLATQRELPDIEFSEKK